MKISHVIAGMPKAAGTTTFVKNVVMGLCARGHDAHVCTRFDEIECGGRPDIVHIHGLWSFLQHRSSWWARQNDIPVIWSTHGMTAPWSMRHKWWKKFLVWHLFQKWDLKHAAAIHCTTDLEVEWNKKLGFKNCFVAPLGTNENSTQGHGDAEGVESGSDCLRVLFVGRIYPVKGLVNLVKAAALIKQSNSLNNRTIRFRIVGPDQAGHRSELMKLAADLKVSEMFEWPGPKFGDELSAEYDSCDLLILPSLTENFGGVVIDALAHGKPVIASEFTPWRELEKERCGWWVELPGEKAKCQGEGEQGTTLDSALREAMVRKDLREMGARGRKLVAERYTWPAVCDRMIKGYEEALNGRA